MERLNTTLSSSKDVEVYSGNEHTDFLMEKKKNTTDECRMIDFKPNASSPSLFIFSLLVITRKHL